MGKEYKKKKWWLWVFPGLFAACLLLVVVSTLTNMSMDKLPVDLDVLSRLNKSRLSEALNLRETLGENVFPGWSQAIPSQILYNQTYVFLVDFPNPQSGWVKVPQEFRRGVNWEQLPPSELWEGMPYYRQTYVEGKSPEAFTVRVGDTYVGSMATFDWLRVSLMDQFRQDLPAFLAPLVPNKLVVSVFVPNTDTYISILEHENFHAYQVTWAPLRFIAAETTNLKQAGSYPWDSETGIQAWKTELLLLKDALQAEDRSEIKNLTGQFLDQRGLRRLSENLSADQIDFENQREWVEGMARYVELETYRLAGSSVSYQSIEEIKSDPLFRNYRGFESRWKRELDQMVRMADDQGDGRFYYSGMAQAYLLDRLLPDWKVQLYANPDLNLEDLLYQSLES